MSSFFFTLPFNNVQFIQNLEGVFPESSVLLRVGVYVLVGVDMSYECISEIVISLMDSVCE